MKLVSMFFTASESILEACFKLRISEREITSLLDYFSKRAKVYSSLSQITNKRARKLSKRMGENLFSHVMSAANFAKSKHEVYFTYFMSVT